MTRAESIKMRLSKATPGPWTRSVVHQYDQTLTYIENEDDEAIVIETASGIKPGDTALICNAPADLAYLLSRVEKLVSAMRETVARADDHGDSWITYPVRDALSELKESE